VVLSAFEINKSFIETKESKIFPIFDYEAESEKLNEKEIGLINVLRNNSRDSLLNIAKKIRLNPRSTITMMKKLQKNNVISGYKTKIDMANLNYHPCIALISINKADRTQFDLFVSYCKQTKGIHYVLYQLGKYDIGLTFDVEDIHRFYEIIQDIRNKFLFVKKITTLIEKHNF
ncbi:Lrp/AsnC family transcriptional regulator, partial [Candidatus Pacearchaeota archaeon]|nr:Lrp/AsnC family transcriptional regulator [Candidatus Pacearchaeota archaeon]